MPFLTSQLLDTLLIFQAAGVYHAVSRSLAIIGIWQFGIELDTSSYDGRDHTR